MKINHFSGIMIEYFQGKLFMRDCSLIEKT